MFSFIIGHTTCIFWYHNDNILPSLRSCLFFFTTFILIYRLYIILVLGIEFRHAVSKEIGVITEIKVVTELYYFLNIVNNLITIK